MNNQISFKKNVYLNKLHQSLTNGLVTDKERNPIETKKYLLNLILKEKYNHYTDEYYNFTTNENFNYNDMLINLRKIHTKIKKSMLAKNHLTFYNDIGGIFKINNNPQNYISIYLSDYNNKLYITYNYDDVYLEYISKKSDDDNLNLYYSQKCSCCSECCGTFEFYGDINNKFSFINNNEYKISLNNCMFNRDYNMIGVYKDEYDLFWSDVTFKDKSVYNGYWFDEQPYGYGKASLRRETSNTDKIKLRKIYGVWKNGLLDVRDNFKIKLYYNSELNYKIAIYNSKIDNRFYLPDIKGEIFYVKDKKLFSHYNGEIKKSVRHGRGKITFYDEQNDIESYKGTFKSNMYNKGKVIFKQPSCFISFEGLFYNYFPSKGSRKSCNGMIYTGYVNENYEAHGEGTINRQQSSEKHNCTCGRDAFKKFDNIKNPTNTKSSSNIISSIFDKISGFWCNDELLFEHEPQSTCVNCSEYRTIICIDCEKYYCETCYDKIHSSRKIHKKSGKYYKYHKLMKLEYMNNDYKTKIISINDKKESRNEIISKISNNITSNTSNTLNEQDINEISELIADKTIDLKHQYKNLSSGITKTIDLKLEKGKYKINKEDGKNITSEKQVEKNGESFEIKPSPPSKLSSTKKKKGKKNKKRKGKKPIKNQSQENSFNHIIDKSIISDSKMKVNSKRIDNVITEVSTISKRDNSFEQLLLDMKEENGGKNEYFLTYKK